MPQVSLSWDLFIVVFFAIVMSYVFIIGKQQSMKIIIATYIAAIAVEGITAVLSRAMMSSGMTLETMGIPVDVTMIALGKIFLFALSIILFILRSGMDISYDKDTGSILNLVYTGLFGFAAGGLMISTILEYTQGSGILESAPALSSTYVLVQLMILNRDVWYTLPAFLIIALSFLHSD